MKTDVLLSHVPHTQGLCFPKSGRVVNEYVVYDASDSRNPVILTLGGSTTAGFYQEISDGDTWPKLLAELAKDAYFVLNGGVGGYSSLQELYKFIRDGSRIENLKIVVSLNGINDTPDYHGVNSDRRGHYPFLTQTQYDMNLRQTWIDQRLSHRTWRKRAKIYFYFVMNSDHAVSRLMPNFVSLVAYMDKQAREAMKDKAKVGPNQNQDTQEMMSIVNAADRWEKNVTRLQTLVALENATYYVFLQPTMGLLGAQSKPQAGSPDEELFLKLGDLSPIRDLYKELKVRCKRLEYCYDISDDVPPSGDVYNDPRHHNAKGNDKLARIIWNIIHTQQTQQQ
tara:strand:- start:7262 stop:8275 length:1014 start_codon:yes stop_codon:yes gene_type:complete